MIEFKNTHHFKMKSYMQEIEGKILDTHMLLAETFWKDRKTEKIAENVRALVVYQDALDYGEGVIKIADSLNRMKPIKGNGKRKLQEDRFYKNEQEYQAAVERLTARYKNTFYKAIDWMDKDDFYEFYIKSNYFKQLA